MGRSKAELPFGQESMLQRIVRLLSLSVSPIVLVTGPTHGDPHPFPSFDVPSNQLIHAHDRQSDQGPLEGLAVGLSVLHPYSDWVFVTACDAPFLTSGWIDCLLRFRSTTKCQTSVARSDDLHVGPWAIVPSSQGKLHPLSALYRTNLTAIIDECLQRGERSLNGFLRYLDQSYGSLVRVESDRLMSVDPELQSLRNVNTPRDYAQALDDLLESDSSS